MGANGGLVLPGMAEPEAASRVRTVLGDAGGDWLCAFCHNRVASENDRFEYDGQDEFSFVNPDGMRFEIITFSRTLGCARSGLPTLDHTWFPGHSWSFCQCARCTMPARKNLSG
jgi:hypothetical protein